MGSRERFDGPFGRPVLRSTCAAVPSFENRRGRKCLERPPGGGGGGERGIHRLEQSRWLRRSARSPNSAHVQRNACCARWLVWPGGGPWSRESACQLTCRASWTGRARNEGRRWQEETTHLFKVGHPDLQMRDRVRYQDALPATRLWSGVCASSLPCALTSADP